MKKIIIILLSLVLLLSTLLQGCADMQNTDGETVENTDDDMLNASDNSNENTDEGNNTSAVKPDIVYSGEYNFSIENLFCYPKVFSTVVIKLLPSLDFPVAEKIELSGDSYNYGGKNFIDKDYAGITEFDFYGTKIQLVYQNSSVSWYGKVYHCFDNAVFDENGKLLTLNGFGQSIDTSQAVITQDQAMEYALEFIRDYTPFEADDYQLSVTPPRQYLDFYSFQFEKTFGYVGTNEIFDIWISKYDGTVLNYTSKYPKLFSDDIVLNIDRDEIESVIRESIKTNHDGFKIGGESPGIDRVITRYSADNVKFQYTLLTAADGTLLLEVQVKEKLELVYYDPHGNEIDKSIEAFGADKFYEETIVFHVYQNQTNDTAD